MLVEERVLPLSSGQLGLWYAQSLDPSSVMNGGQYVEIHGPVDRDAFEAALRRVIAEADALRLRFAEDAQGPRQIVGPIVDWHLPFVDVSGERDPLGAAVAWMTADMNTRDDVARGPLFTFALFRLADDRHVWYQRYHHLVSDGFGRWLVTKRASEIYGSLIDGVTVSDNPFGPLDACLDEDAAYRASAQYWQDRQYWNDRFAGGSRPAGPGKWATSAGPTVRRTAHVSAAMKDALRRIGQQAGATLPQVITAIVAAYVSRTTDAEDVVLGTAIRNRVGAAAKRTPGMTSNIVALRIAPRMDRDIADVVRQIGVAMREAVRHQRYRIEDLRRDLGSHVTAQDLFWPAVNFQSFDYDLRIGGHATTFHSLPQPWTDNLVVIIHDRAEHGPLEIHVDANGRLYADSEIAAFRTHLAHLLDGVAREPDRPIGRVDLLPSEERDRIAAALTGAVREYPSASVPALFDAQAMRTPRATAIICGGDEMTYEALADRANRLARDLIRLGVRRHGRVAVCLERGVDMVIALLAVLKAGATYVPLDPESPADRLACMLADSGAPLVLTQERLATSLPAHAAEMLCIDGDRRPIADASATGLPNPPSLDVGASDLAYVMYTSGSTGTPKGTGVSHRAIVNLARNEFVDIAPGDRIGQLSNASFDALTFEVWGALLNGAAIVIVPHDVVVSPPALAAAIRDRRIDTLFLTTALFNEVVRDTPEAFDGVRDLLFGGEAVDPRWVRTLLRRGAVSRLLHVYGPTETTTFSTWYRIDDVREDASTVPIGRPLANARAYVLDRHLQRVPFGAVGELYLAGDGVARGYWRAPALTAQRFVADPFGPAGGRMYRTGDLVRCRADGDLEFVGRRDHQVKIRGFRVELGEIETALRQQSDVRDAIVVVREPAPGEKRLTGYVVPAAGHSLDASALRQRLMRVLPAYMVPPTVMILDSLPVTPQGKVDRRALPAPAATAAGIYREPRTPEEEILCGVFADVLGVDRVGLDDDFFALGGHSLLATRAVSRIRTLLGVELAIRTLFDAPTVGELSPRVREGGAARPPLVPRPRPDPLPVSYAQQRLWFIDRLEGGSTGYHLPEALRLRGPLDRAALLHAMDAVVARHESLRTSFVEVDSRPVQVIAASLHLDMPVDDLRGLPADERQARVQQVLRREWEEPFDLVRGPLLRVRLLQLDEDDHVLVRTQHHIVSDGWSQGVFQREWLALYAAFRARREDPLPPLAVQYVDFALWQRDWLDGGALDEGLAYWTTQLTGSPERLALVTDRPRPPRQTFAAKRHQVSLPAAASDALKQAGRQRHATLYMTLLAAYGVLLARDSGQDDLIVGTPVANRLDTALEASIGFFVNALALRLCVRPEMRFAALLEDVRRTTLEAYRYQDVPFERIVEALAPPRSLNTPPLFQVTFALQNASSTASPLPDLSVEPIVADEARVRFDLEVHAFEQPDGAIAFAWVYNTALFDRWRIEQMARHYLDLLTAAGRNPDATVAELAVLSADERRQILDAWNADAQPAVRASVPALFEAWAARTPDATAVVPAQDHARAASYAVVNARANRLARFLRVHGIGAESVVAVSLPRSLDLIVALVAIVKTGAAYLPVDAREPAKRLTGLLRDAGATAILSAGTLPPPAVSPLRLLALDVADRRVASYSDENLDERIDPRRLAYVMSTSGSTGTPKGILVSHEAIVHLVRDTNYVAIRESDRIAHLAHPSFDAATFEIWGALLNGAAVIVIDKDTALHPAALADAFARGGVTTTFLTTALFNQMAREAPAAFAGLRDVLFGGELADPRWPREVRRAGAPARLLHVYGPTEATTFASFDVVEDVAEDAVTIPIGHAVSGTRLYVLDRLLAPAPAGVVGELYIAGAGLARGYAGRTALTSTRFVADPHGAAGTRMYRTGDLARWRPAGRLEFVGRVDTQIKIRGFRVELGEIEAALLQHAGVRECRVVFYGADAAERQLVAYWIPSLAVTCSRADLRQHLKQHVPEYMMPADVVQVDAWPLNKNGKVDVDALPRPGASGAGGTGADAPRDHLQTIVADVWKQALQREDIGIFDNYFDLGAHSLMLIQVQNDLNARLNCQVRIIDLFTYSTVASLAEYIRQQQTGEVEDLDEADRPAESVTEAKAGRGDRLGRRLAGR